MPARQPNILLVMYDQLSAQSLAAYGHPLVRTPHIDTLAADGVVFDDAYCASPLCAPARFAMMAGRLCSGIGAWDNAAEFPAEVPTFAHVLRRAGYRTVLSGKMHFVGPDQLHGFEQRLTTDMYPADFGWTPDWRKPDERVFWHHNMQSVVESGVYQRTLEIDYDEEVAYTAVRRLYDLARDDDPRPWFMTASFMHPHDPFMTPRECWDRYRHDDIDMPRVAALPDAQMAPHGRRLRRLYAIDEYEVTDEHVRNARHAYYGMTSWGDDRLGELLYALDMTGQRDNTIVVLTSDHGEMLGEHGLWYKMSFRERSARVPLIVTAPGRFAHRRIAEPVSHLDLLPTLAALAGDDETGGPGLPLDGDTGPGHRDVVGGAPGDRDLAGAGELLILRRNRDGDLRHLRVRHHRIDHPEGAHIGRLAHVAGRIGRDRPHQVGVRLQRRRDAPAGAGAPGSAEVGLEHRRIAPAAVRLQVVVIR